MAVGGLYIAYRIRRIVLPFVQVYGRWVEEQIIPMTDQLQKMAEEVEKKTYDDLMSQPAGEDYSSDGSEEAEAAHDVGLSFFEDISKMYQATLNLFSAGLFHVAEQQLADLTRDAAIQNEVSETKLDEVVTWYTKNCQLELAQFPKWSVIHELRLVANSTKHGEGSAARQLRAKHPELFVYPALRKDDPKTIVLSPLSLPLCGNGLYVTGDEFLNYHETVLELFEWLRKHFENHGDEYFPH